MVKENQDNLKTTTRYDKLRNWKKLRDEILHQLKSIKPEDETISIPSGAQVVSEDYDLDL